MKGTISISWGEYGGFYFNNGFTKRICLGWIAFTYLPIEIDDILDNKEIALKLIAEQKAYLEFLNAANETPISIAHNHGWKCPDSDIQKGIEFREKIKQLENDI